MQIGATIYISSQAIHRSRAMGLRAVNRDCGMLRALRARKFIIIRLARKIEQTARMDGCSQISGISVRRVRLPFISRPRHRRRSSSPLAVCVSSLCARDILAAAVTPEKYLAEMLNRRGKRLDRAGFGNPIRLSFSEYIRGRSRKTSLLLSA